MYDTCLENFGILVVMTVLVDEGGHAAICKAGDRITVSHGEEPDDVQVLVGGGAPSEPAVIRDVHHESGTFADGVSDQVSKDSVVANVRSPIVRSIDGRFFSRDKVAFAQIHVVQDGEDFVKRNTLAEGDEVLFDVTSWETVIPWRKEERCIVDFKAARVVEVSRDALVVQRTGEDG